MEGEKIMKKIVINDIEISETSLPFIIAEAGVNYYEISEKRKISLLEAAKLMIEEAYKAGASAIKFQTYKAEKLASKYSPSYWDRSKETSKSQYELFRRYDKFGENEYEQLAEYAKNIGIIFMSTPFDFYSADFLDKLVPVFKIASSDITNIPFLKYIARKKKPIFLSTGASTIKEIREAVHAIESEGNKQIVIMHCILSYPTAYNDANLNMILDIKEKFPEHIVGYSDHTLPDKKMLVLTTAYLLGAKVIEKHFTLDKTLKGNDHYHAMDPIDLKNFVNNINFLKIILGDRIKKPISSELLSRKYARRSIVARVNIHKGEVISKEMVTFKRPGTGISPGELDKVIGKRAKEEINEDKVITWNMLENLN